LPGEGTSERGDCVTLWGVKLFQGMRRVGQTVVPREGVREDILITVDTYVCYLLTCFYVLEWTTHSSIAMVNTEQNS